MDTGKIAALVSVASLLELALGARAVAGEAGMKTVETLLLTLGVLIVLSISVVQGAELPPVERLQEQMGTPPATIDVHEPIASFGDRDVMVEYVGYPAFDVMARLFGRDWHAEAETVELRALDGYVSRIDAARFLKETAFLVFARADGAPFAVDHIRQNRTDVPLGPYYLVWDNISNPALQAEGAVNWPYQVHEVNLVSLSDSALVPDGLPTDLREGAELAKRFCLQCHKVNGLGGDKFPGNLAQIARVHPEADFIRWVLKPSSVRDNTNMPPLSDRLPEPQRRRIAKTLFDYLTAVPILR